MEPNAFIGWPTQPTDADLAAALGTAKPLWDDLIAAVAAEIDGTIQEWRSYSVKTGWASRLKRGKRTIVWLGPRAGGFCVLFILGAKAVAEARAAKLPAAVVRALDEAPKYPEGTGLRLPIKGPKDIALVKKLAAIKMRN